MFKVLHQLVSVTGAVTYLFISVSMILPPILGSLVALCFRFVHLCVYVHACQAEVFSPPACHRLLVFVAVLSVNQSLSSIIGMRCT